ncbi:bifunctional Ribosomal protein L9 [Babesia duncani]|uniref:Bifunctional Ribosomal protein L9 n=1 Tax=Babesia duncani TaxID=323732 RepID=A0AAD9PNC6_9APIC|nr:bifunctional Ribosomal protein L9 [Babesia duncani]
MFNKLFKRTKISFVKGTISRRVWYPRVVDKNINVILLEKSNLGPRGKIIEVPRGYANYKLIPQGLAVVANWENVKLHADILLKSTTQFPSDSTVLNNRLGKDMSNQFKLEFKPKVFSKCPNLLTEPISIFQLLHALATRYNIDVIPSNVEAVHLLDSDGNWVQIEDYSVFNSVGKFKLLAKFPLKNDASNRITIQVDIQTSGSASSRFVSTIKIACSSNQLAVFKLPIGMQ